MAIAMMMVAVGCSRVENPNFSQVDDPNAVIFRATVAADTRVNTEGSGDVFIEGDYFAVSNEISNLDNWMLPMDIYMYQEGAWAFFPEPDEAYLLWKTGENNFYACMPTDAGMYSYFYLNDDQSDIFGLRYADWMTAKVEGVTKTEDRTVDLEFRHMLSKVVVNITKTDASYASDAYISDATFRALMENEHNVYPHNDGKITPYVDGKSMMVVLVPGTYAEGEVFLTFNYGGQYLTVRAPQGGITLDVAGSYTFGLEVGPANANGVIISSVTVEPWVGTFLEAGVATEQAQPWYVIGSFNDWYCGDANYAMTYKGDYYVYKGLEVVDSVEMKFNVGNWEINRGGNYAGIDAAVLLTKDGPNIKLYSGVYDIYLSKEADVAYFMSEGNEPEPIATYTASEALEQITSGAFDPNAAVYVTGVVTKIKEVSVAYGNATYYLSDNANDTTNFYVYRGRYLNGDHFTSETQLMVGDEVKILGKLMNYKGTTPEVATGSHIVSIVEVERPAEPIELGLMVEKHPEYSDVWIGSVYPSDQERYYMVGLMVSSDLELYYQEGMIKEPTVEAYAEYYSQYVLEVAAENPEFTLQEVIDALLMDSGCVGMASFEFGAGEGQNYFAAFALDSEAKVEGLNYIMYYDSEDVPVEDNKLWGLVGEFNNWGNADDAGIVISDIAFERGEDGIYYAINVTIAGEFKIRPDNTWDLGDYGVSVYGEVTKNHAYALTEQGANMMILNGTYDIYFDSANAKLYVMTPGSHYSVATDAEPIVGPYYATVAEVIAAEESDYVYYQITGTVKNISNTTYGNFYIEDETGSIYVYGLLTGRGGASKQFASLGIDEGETLTLVALRSSYNGTEQLKNAYYVSHEDIEIDVPEMPEGEFSSNIDIVSNVGNGVNAYAQKALIGSVEYDVLKLGTGSKVGSYATPALGVESGVYDLSFYAVSWKGKNDAVLTVEISSIADTTMSDVYEIPIFPNEGATGNAPYTLTLTEDDKYIIEGLYLSSENTISFSTDAVTYRAIITGANLTLREE